MTIEDEHQLKGVFAYDESSPTGISRKGQPAGWLDVSTGYYVIERLERKLFCHRVVFELLNGPIPKGLQVDHINGVKTDNRIENLRLATHSENQRNAATRTDSTTGVKGLTPHKDGWRGKIQCNGLRYYKFSTNRAEVEAWLMSTRRQLHGEFARHE